MMTRTELYRRADVVLGQLARASDGNGPTESAVDATIDDVRRLAHYARELLALERVQAMEHFRLESYREQGFSDCDVCGRLATWTWERTPAQRKKMQGPKVRGARAQVLPVAWRCNIHFPHAFPEWAEQYRDARVKRAATVAA